MEESDERFERTFYLLFQGTRDLYRGCDRVDLQKQILNSRIEENETWSQQQSDAIVTTASV
jgi:hypothetical protein